MRNVFALVAGGLAVLPLLMPVGDASAEELGGLAPVGKCTTISITGSEVKITGKFNGVTLHDCKAKLPKIHEESRRDRLAAAKRLAEEGNPQTPRDVTRSVNQSSPVGIYVIEYAANENIQCFGMGDVPVVSINTWKCGVLKNNHE